MTGAEFLGGLAFLTFCLCAALVCIFLSEMQRERIKRGSRKPAKRMFYIAVLWLTAVTFLLAFILVVIKGMAALDMTVPA